MHTRTRFPANYHEPYYISYFDDTDLVYVCMHVWKRTGEDIPGGGFSAAQTPVRAPFKSSYL
jgi:hypothetical protein